jgi:hypothetical protein
MERQAGLGRSLEDVLESLAPVEPADSASRHALFGLAPDHALATEEAEKPEKAKNPKTKTKKSGEPKDQKKKNKNKKKKSGKKSGK